MNTDSISKRVIECISGSGGKIEHSALLRKVYLYIDTRQLHYCLNSLKKAKVIGQSPGGTNRIYFLIDHEN